MDIYTYKINNSLYINLTNRCQNNCDFCIRNNHKPYGYELWIEKEPTVETILAQIPDPQIYDEIVFCGFGESTTRLEELIDISRALKQKGATIRLDTNGLASITTSRNVPGLLHGLIDIVSISLNAPNAKRYDKICHSVFGEAAFDAIIDFIKESVKYIPKVILTVVDVISPEEIRQCREIAERLGADFKVRKYIDK